MQNPINEIISNKIISVIRAETPLEAIEKATAMINGGLRAFEITVENGAILPAITELRKNNNVTVMAGGIITSEKAGKAIEYGAQAIISPVLQGSLMKYCLSKRIAHIATVSTPNEAYTAWKSRIPLIKIFPAKPMGQVEYIEDMLRPMSFLKLIPTGGISLDDYIDYLKVGATAVGLGRCLYKDATLKEITERTKYAVSKLEELSE